MMRNLIDKYGRIGILLSVMGALVLATGCGRQGALERPEQTKVEQKERSEAQKKSSKKPDEESSEEESGYTY